MSSTLDTDYLAAMRADLVAVLESLDIPWHDHEPKALGDTPAAWFGRPILLYDQYEKEVVAQWPLTLAGHPVDPEETTHEFDHTVWELWRALGLGRRAMVDGQRSVAATEARPALQTIGDHQYPTYNLTITTTVHTGIC